MVRYILPQDNRTRKKFFRFANVKIGEGVAKNQNLVIIHNYEPL